MDDSLACLLPEGSSPQNPTWSDRALQRKHRSPEQDYHRLRSLPGGSVRRCPVCVPRTARNGSSRRSHQARAAILAGPSVSESRVFTQPGAEPDTRQRFQADTGVTADELREKGMDYVAERYAYGPTRVQFAAKDPRGFAE